MLWKELPSRRSGRPFFRCLYLVLHAAARHPSPVKASKAPVVDRRPSLPRPKPQQTAKV